MPDVAKRFGKGSMSAAPKTIYTVPTGKKAFVKAVTFCNVDPSSAVLVTMKLADTAVIMSHKIRSRDTITLPFLDQILEAGETIILNCEPDSGGSGYVFPTFYISGREVDV